MACVKYGTTKDLVSNEWIVNLNGYYWKDLFYWKIPLNSFDWVELILFLFNSFNRTKMTLSSHQIIELIYKYSFLAAYYTRAHVSNFTKKIFFLNSFSIDIWKEKNCHQNTETIGIFPTIQYKKKLKKIIAWQLLPASW